MAEQSPASCPVCGGASQQFASVFAELMAQREQARQAGEQARAAQPPPQRPTLAGSGHGPVSGEEMLLRAAVDIAGEVLHQAAKPLARRAGQAVSAAQARGAAAMETARAVVDRHPEIYCCQRDEIVFAGGNGGRVPVGVAMRFLIRGDEAALVTALQGGA
ncbi:MAG TPA: hypothetical protein VGS19_16530 [Streptosporangiaceae bacterium]|nr:hypothetical protein [Streptosporangiaceae bacterium]